MVMQMVTNSIENPEPDSQQLILKALESGWKKYRKELKRCREEASFDAIHDLRTATRRILAMIQLLNSISPRPRLQKLIRAFKDQLDIVDDLRDTQVTVAGISDTVQKFPQLEPFQKHMLRVEEKTLRKVRKKIETLETTEVKKRMRKTRKALATGVTGDFRSKVLQAVDDAYQKIEERYIRVDPAQPSTIHRVRIAFKSFRYMMEAIHPLLKDFPEENLERMNDYQTLMGDIQDLEVTSQTLADYSESDPLPDPEPVQSYYEQRRTEAISAYMEGMSQLHSFWRAGPQQPFPWEKTA
jgi:CHAD domain-containing protein